MRMIGRNEGHDDPGMGESSRERVDNGSQPLKKVADCTPPRSFLYGVGIAAGVVAGFANSLLDIDMSLKPSLFGWALASVIVVVALHEGTHGAVAALLGHKPLFGLRPPLIYITFKGKLPRGHLMVVAIAPFVVLNLLFGFLYSRGALKLFCDLCLIINSIGSAADIWVVLKLIGAPKGAWIQDTKTGFEVWVADGAGKPDLATPKEG
jgi:hypothetical protein